MMTNKKKKYYTWENLANRSSGLISKILGSNIVPES